MDMPGSELSNQKTCTHFNVTK